MIENNSNPKFTDHLANERTFLAWVRTCIAIMAFGFVVERFAFFIKKIIGFLESNATGEPSQSSQALEASSVFGIFLVVLGTCISLIAYIKYKKIERQINSGVYQPSTLIDTILTISVLLIGFFLMVYLLESS